MNDVLKNAIELLKILEQHNHEAYIVGGFVRDYLCDIESYDVDITTSASVDEVEALFEESKKTGSDFGTITVYKGEYSYEITTFRLEQDYKDHRKPSVVEYTTEVKNDVVRRDFTMNALLMDKDLHIIDYFSGKEDISNKVIKTIGDPDTRFTEDALRMLRAFRFVSKLGFVVEEETLESIKKNAHLIEHLSSDRILGELKKILSNPYKKEAISYMEECGVLDYLLGLKKGLEILLNKEQYSVIEALCLCYNVGDLSRYSFTRNEKHLFELAGMISEVTKEDEFNMFILFSRKLDVCLLANKINVLQGYKDQSDLIRDLDQNLVVKDVCDLKFKGQDILALTNLKKRSIIAQVIDQILYHVLMGNMKNDYDEIKEFAIGYINQMQEKGE